MNVTLTGEAGYEQAVQALARSYEWNGLDGERRGTPLSRARAILPKLAWQPGHSKPLRSMWVWYTVERGPRCWWMEFLTHILGSEEISPDDWTMNSQSTIHTLLKREIVLADFEDFDDLDYLAKLNAIRLTGDLIKLKRWLPEGYMQTRDFAMNYACLQNLAKQRTGHKDPLWGVLLEALRNQLYHPEFVFKEDK